MQALLWTLTMQRRCVLFLLVEVHIYKESDRWIEKAIPEKHDRFTIHLKLIRLVSTCNTESFLDKMCMIK